MAKRKSELSKNYAEIRAEKEMERFQQAVRRIELGKEDLLKAGFHPTSIRMGEDLYSILDRHRMELTASHRKVTRVCELDIIKDGNLQNNAEFVIESAEYIAARESTATEGGEL